MDCPHYESCKTRQIKAQYYIRAPTRSCQFSALIQQTRRNQMLKSNVVLF